jgi:hypothetical protein
VAPESAQPPPNEQPAGTTPPAALPDQPRPVGNLHVVTNPADASFVLQALDDGHQVRGRTPLAAPLSLPVGAYSVEISARYCAAYHDTVRVAAAHTSPLHVRLVCGT